MAHTSFSEIKFTKLEKSAIDAGWRDLETIAARLGWTGSDMLRAALKTETTGAQRVPSTFAKGMLCGWFVRGGDLAVRDLFGTRDASISMAIMAARATHDDKVSRAEWEALRLAAKAKETAFARLG